MPYYGEQYSKPRTHHDASYPHARSHYYTFDDHSACQIYLSAKGIEGDERMQTAFNKILGTADAVSHHSFYRSYADDFQRLVSEKMALEQALGKHRDYNYFVDAAYELCKPASDPSCSQRKLKLHAEKIKDLIKYDIGKLKGQAEKAGVKPKAYLPPSEEARDGDQDNRKRHSKGSRSGEYRHRHHSQRVSPFTNQVIEETHESGRTGHHQYHKHSRRSSQSSKSGCRSM